MAASQAQLSSLQSLVADLQKVIDGSSGPSRRSSSIPRAYATKAAAAAKDEALLDPVQTGDLITLMGTEGPETAGLLYGARAELHIGVQSQGARAALNYNDYAFRV